MIWVIGIPAIAIILVMILVGGFRPGPILTGTGILLFIVGGISLIVGFCHDDDEAKSNWIAGALLSLVCGAITFAIGRYFGNHTLFDFLF